MSRPNSAKPAKAPTGAGTVGADAACPPLNSLTSRELLLIEARPFNILVEWLGLPEAQFRVVFQGELVLSQEGAAEVISAILYAFSKEYQENIYVRRFRVVEK